MALGITREFLPVNKKTDKRTVEIYEDFILGENPYLIVDGSNIFQQAFHGAKGVMYNSDGKETGGIVIFIKMMLNFLHALSPRKCFCTLDYGISARRASLFKDYKIGRKEKRATEEALMGEAAAAEERENYFYQFNNCQAFLKASSINEIILKGVEADSSVGYLVKKIRDESDEVPIVIISTDKDFYQLFSYDNVFIFNPRTKQFIDKKNFHKKLDLDPCIIPEQLPLIRSIMGDKSDSIPGVTLPKKNPKSTRVIGIGGKTISKLYREASQKKIDIFSHDDIRDYLESKSTLKGYEEAILENENLIDLNIQLMDLINITDYMTVQSRMDLDEIFSNEPQLQSKLIHRIFEENDCESYIMSFQTIKGILKKLGKSVTEKDTSDIDWNKI